MSYQRKKKPCPECGKPILLTSKFCYSCTQKGKRNKNYKDGHSCFDRFCENCGARITSSSKGFCTNCYDKSGKNNPNYKNGHFLREFYNTIEYKKWKLSVFERDKRTCQLCNKEVKHTGNAHHIFPKRDFPELVYNLDNGITLCKECHRLINKKEYEFIDIFLSIIRPNKNSVNSVDGEIPNTEPSVVRNYHEGVTTRDEPKT